MRESFWSGVSFGLTSGAITTMGLVVGLNSGTKSRLAVLGGIITVAIADAFSDALGIHIHEESEGDHSHAEIWAATVATFASKFLLGVTFLLPVLLLPLASAIVVSVAWGLGIVAVLSFVIAHNQEGGSPWKATAEHVFIAALVVVVAYYTGEWVAVTFGETP